jgi:hypothetical protein
MSQYTLPLSNHKNGHGRRERDLAADLKDWLGDLDAAEALRRDQLRQIAELRAQVYRHAKVRGVTSATLRATRQLLRLTKIETSTKQPKD